MHRCYFCVKASEVQLFGHTSSGGLVMEQESLRHVLPGDTYTSKTVHFMLRRIITTYLNVPIISGFSRWILTMRMGYTRAHNSIV